jgi:hypothetical protein
MNSKYMHFLVTHTFSFDIPRVDGIFSNFQDAQLFLSNNCLNSNYDEMYDTFTITEWLNEKFIVQYVYKNGQFEKRNQYVQV